ncbi:MAG: TolC family protein [Lentisphaeria bacterium]|nr:TolC family protein [Lentisphaeria bacterium]
MRKTFFSAVLTVAALSAAMLAGCKSEEDFRNERAENAMKHFEASRFKQPADGRTLTLRNCIELAQKNNLELKVRQLEEQVAREQKTAELLGMLPELNVKNTFTARSNTAASSSRKLEGSGMTYGYSTSTDRNVNVFSTEVALSTLDFGLAFFNTVQANDRELMKRQRLRRTSQNLTLDVVRSYFKVAAAQRAITITRKLLEDCRGRYELIEKLSKSRAITPFRAFDETRQFVDMEKRLTSYIRNYENSCVELRALLGLDPSGKIRVDESALDSIPRMEFPELTLLEQIALLERPELYETDMRKHINVTECRKELIKMLPSARLFIDFTKDNNSYLYHASWYGIGISAAYNLLKLPQHIASYMAYDSMADAEAAKAYSLGVGIMAQVRISHSNLMSVKERFAIDDRVYSAYRKNLQWALANRKAAGELSQLELDHIRLETAEKEISRIVSLGNVYVAYFQVLNTLGVSKIDSESLDAVKAELDAARVRAEGELAKAQAEYNSRLTGADAKKSSEKPAEKPFDLVNRPLTTLGGSDDLTGSL